MSYIKVKSHGKLLPIDSCKNLTAKLNEGAGLILRFEDWPSSPVQESVTSLQDVVRRSFGTASTVHLYVAATVESRALLPHTDPYDVLVLQLDGSKEWTACTPHAETLMEQVRDLGSSIVDIKKLSKMNPAQRAQLQEIIKEQQAGCTTYNDEDLSNMQCTTFTLSRGNVMYMPKGVVHYAVSKDKQGSTHITLSLQREGMTWADALLYGMTHGADLIDRTDYTTAWATALKQVTGIPNGIEYLDALPSWQAVSGQLCLPEDVAPTNDEKLAFISQFRELCSDLKQHTRHAFKQTRVTIESFLVPNAVDTVVERICSVETARVVLDEFCAKGRLPVDVTSKLFRADPTQALEVLF